MNPELKAAMFLTTAAFMAACNRAPKSPKEVDPTNLPTPTPYHTPTPEVGIGISPDRSTFTTRTNTDTGAVANDFFELGLTDSPVDCKTGIERIPANQVYLAPVTVDGVTEYKIRQMSTLDIAPDCIKFMPYATATPTRISNAYDAVRATQAIEDLFTPTPLPDINILIMAEKQRLDKQVAADQLKVQLAIIAGGILTALGISRFAKNRKSHKPQIIQNIKTQPFHTVEAGGHVIIADGRPVSPVNYETRPVGDIETTNVNDRLSKLPLLKQMLAVESGLSPEMVEKHIRIAKHQALVNPEKKGAFYWVVDPSKDGKVVGLNWLDENKDTNNK